MTPSSQLHKSGLALCSIFLACLLTGQDCLNMSLLSNVRFSDIGNDVWTYVDSNSREYVIAGNRTDSKIYDITDPSSPQLIAEIPGDRSVWRDYKSYKNFLYGVADQGDDGVTIIDMTNVPNSVSFTMWTDTVRISSETDVIKRCHNIYIDTIKGHAYLAGCNNGVGGVITLNLRKDQKTPQVIGVQDQAYAHDVIVQDSFMYTSEILAGALGVYNIQDSSDAIFVNNTFTSTVFTHNAWPSDDGRFIFTTDEKGNAYVDAYDISDINNILRIDQYRPANDSDILPHNTHYYNGYLVTSWYTEGVIILDASRPHNLIRIAQYDTNPQDANGNWGVSPYLPSGNIVATDMDNGLFILKADYQRAAYLEGIVYDSFSRLPINKVAVSILSDLAQGETSNPRGVYATGIPESGSYQVEVSHPNYTTDTITINLVQGELTLRNIALLPKQTFRISGTVSDAESQDLIEDAIIALQGNIEFSSSTNEKGAYRSDVPIDNYNVVVGKWGYTYLYDSLEIDQQINKDYQLSRGYQDNFDLNLGWTVSGSSQSGQWFRAVPLGTNFGVGFANPNQDSPNDLGARAYVTGNNSDSASTDDVDNGPTILTSPLIDLSNFDNAIIEFDYWFFNEGGNGEPNDKLQVYLLTDIDTINVREFNENAEWRTESIAVGDWTDSDTIKLQFSISGDSPDHILEAGIDALSIFDDVSSYTDEASNLELEVYPNPAIHYTQVINGPEDLSKATLIYATGRQFQLNINSSVIEWGEIPSGQYYLILQDQNRKMYATKIQIIR